MEVSEFQQWAFEQLADIPEVVKEHMPERRVRRRIAEQIVDSSLAGCGGAFLHFMSAWRWQETEFERCVSAWRQQETEHERCMSTWRWQETEPEGRVSEHKVLHGRH